MFALSRVVLLGGPLLILALALPLTFRLIPLNRFYGYRTDWSLASPENWYHANTAAGVALTIAGVLMLAIGAGFERWEPRWTDAPPLLVAMLAQGAILALAMVVVALRGDGQRRADLPAVRLNTRACPEVEARGSARTMHNFHSN